MIRKTKSGNSKVRARSFEAAAQARREQGFTLVEMLIALVIMSGAFVALAGSIPLAAVLHRSAMERELALSLARFEMEYFLTNPGPLSGDSGHTVDFANAAEFPQGYSGSYSASTLEGSTGLTLIVVTVTPPHAPKVELSGIDTTYANVVR